MVITTHPSTEENQLFGHPRGIAAVASLGIWERFSFYGTQVVLLYYLYFKTSEGGLGLSPAEAISIVGTYGALVYCATVFGGWVSDRILGTERTLFYSAITIMCGHIALALVPGMTGVVVGLGLLIIGSGGAITNMPSSVGTLYAERDPRRDAGFTLFYMALNVGALGGPLLTGLVRNEAGFHYGFGTASIGMAIGLVLYSIGRRTMPNAGRLVPNPLPTAGIVRGALTMAAVLVCVAVALINKIITPTNFPKIVTAVVAVITISYFTRMLRSTEVTPVERDRVLALIPLFVAGSAFFALYQQQFTVVQVYAASRVDLHILGWSIPPEFFNSVVPAFVILLAPIFAAFWRRPENRQPSTPVKFLISLLGISAAFLLFVPLAGTDGPRVSPWALMGILFVFTVAELFVAPVMLSVATKLAPRVFRAQTVALMFLSIALGSAGGSIVASNYSPDDEARYFVSVAVAAIVVAAVFAAAIPWTRRKMSGQF